MASQAKHIVIGSKRRIGTLMRRSKSSVDRYRALRSAVQQDRRLSPQCVTTIDIGHDEMFEWSNPRHYFSVGRSGLAAIKVGLDRANVQSVSRIVDVPCGHGRVLRMLRAQWPDADIVACDINRAGVDFCARTFNATPLYSANPLTVVKADTDYDLVWVGSLLTHLHPSRWPEVLTWLRDRLRPDGVVIFSTHGVGAIDLLQQGVSYGVEAGPLLDGYYTNGVGYVDYPQAQGYGISLTSRAWTCGAVADVGGLTLVDIAERAWDNHHDVVTCVRQS